MTDGVFVYCVSTMTDSPACFLACQPSLLARTLIICKKIFSGLGVGWVGKWLAAIALQLPVLQILWHCIYYSDNLKAYIKDS